MICQQVPLSGDAEWPKVADAVIEAEHFFWGDRAEIGRNQSFVKRAEGSASPSRQLSLIHAAGNLASFL